MQTKTSSELSDEYQKARKFEERLEKANRGKNLLSPTETPRKKFFVRVIKDGSQTLTDKEEKVYVLSDLPCMNWEYHNRDKGVKDFIRDLKAFVSIPKYVPIARYNRRRENARSDWHAPKIRSYTLTMDDIFVSIGHSAQEELENQGIDFIGGLGRTLLLQRDATEQEAEDFERYLLLWDSVSDLSRQVTNKKTDNYSYASYDSREDKTIKLSIGSDSYNNQLRGIAQEMKILHKKYPFLVMPDIKLIKKVKLPTFRAFMRDNKDDLTEAWDELDDADKAEYDGDFKVFAKQKFEEWKSVSDDEEFESDDSEDEDEDEAVEEDDDEE